ncbi:hypothetical protein PRZ48_007989 [Zasmidium cellare]|uniref:RING-type domain-containing protein n=1 Tax=Zasmidium cellare TaxID=395010 RepID=A0ABR0EF34_ZASCE|nr:hypothetical protein PRZ48_007989 [Zasmidium cellare]
MQTSDQLTAHYKAQLLRGQLPSVYLPRPNDTIVTTAATSNQESLCDACQKPRDRDSLPGHFALVGMECFHSFCTQCCLKMAGKVTCPAPGCTMPIPTSTQQAVASQLRHWAVQKALEFCEDGTYSSFLWRFGPEPTDVDPCFDKASTFLQNDCASTKGTAAYIDMESLRPHLVGIANLILRMRYAEAMMRDLDSDPTDKAFERSWIKTILAVDLFLTKQAKSGKSCQASMLRQFLEININEGSADEDASLLFDFVVDVCKEEAQKRSWRTKSASAMTKVAARVKSFQAG